MAGTPTHSSGTSNQMLRSAKSLRPTGIRASRGWLGSRRRQFCAAICSAVFALAIAAGLLRGHAQESFPLPAFDPPKNTSPAKPQAAADPHQPEVASQCASLLKMATDLKLEIDKTNKDTLSINVVRKAGAIEELAHKVRTGSGKD